MVQPLKLGMLGLDTSHVSAFAKLLNDPTDPYHVPGGIITAAYSGGSNDLEASFKRVDGFTEELRGRYGVTIMESPEQVAAHCDALFISSVDGRTHYDYLKQIAEYGKPVFVDKPFTISSEEAKQMFELAGLHRIPIMSCSSLRYADALTECLNACKQEEIIGADTYGPMYTEPTHPGLFWYGIHSVEMLFAILGKRCLRVSARTNDDHDLITGEWEDGRIGTVRGNRRGNGNFGALVHCLNTTKFADVYAYPKPYYASMLEKIMRMFTEGTSEIDPDETIAIIRFIEAANESRETGNTVSL
ncbi:Gfo/Idh/MocA family protein [Paenibacillus solisilvae]|uniref:Gfo/Idh/MocA family protein n=1 Tax=Paenibacillus solisilvae TaxID=2486751 RepID=A0ABW0VRY1_9BACL